MVASLPIDSVLPDIGRALRADGRLVLQAPPGAGKTTRVPLYLLENKICDGRILMLEPRRVAARSAAQFMASTLGEEAGQTVGYRMRGEAKTSRATKIEVVTEGILTRMLQSDPELTGVGCVIFDEFHERSLQADLGLALAIEVRNALRLDLQILVMSATLDAAPVAALMDGAPVVTSEGRGFPIETRWLDAPWGKPGDRGRSFVPTAISLITKAVSETTGGVLVFLPGVGDIRRVQSGLSLGGKVDVVPLYGGLPFKEQMRALEPAAEGRRNVVLATAIAETSLTLPDIRVVVDCGRSRRSRFDPGSGMSRLVTERVTKAEAAQRQGRSGRVAEGICYRMWTKGEEGGMAPFPPVEIEDNDLLGLTLELAIWGVSDPAEMSFLTPPPTGPFREAQNLLKTFGALDEGGRVTPHGRTIAKLPLHPRLGHMVERAIELKMGWTGPALAALLSVVRGPMPDHDCGVLLNILRAGRDKLPVFAEARREMKRIGNGADTGGLSAGAVLSLAYPDRIGQRRSRADSRFVMSSGKGAVLAHESQFSGADFLAIADLDGDMRDAKIRLAAPIVEAELRDLHDVETLDVCAWDKRKSAVLAERQIRLGSIVLERKPATGSIEAAKDAMLEGVRSLGLNALPWTKDMRELCRRSEWVRTRGGDVPDMSDAGLTSGLHDWLSPYLDGVLTRAGLTIVDLRSALEARLGWEQMSAINRLAPQKYVAPTGTGVRIVYEGELPKISIRLQELMGLTQHPVVGPDHTPLLIELLSPAQRPIQTTADLPGFWTSSYADVRKDMRGRYPKHHWPENPAEAEPTRRVKQRKTSG